MRAYVTTLSRGIFLISSRFMSRIVFVPFVSPYPCADLPSSLHIASSHVSRSMGSSINFLYFVIVSFETGCTTPLATCSGLQFSLSSTRLFNVSMKMFPMNLFNAPLVIPADGGLMKVLPLAILIW